LLELSYIYKEIIILLKIFKRSSYVLKNNSSTQDGKYELLNIGIFLENS